jgi:hypothetical protein
MARLTKSREICEIRGRENDERMNKRRGTKTEKRKNETRFETCTLSTRLTLQKCSSRHSTDTEVSKATKGITNATMMSKTKIVS